MSTRADLVIENATVLTLDERSSVHEAIALHGGRVVGLGANGEFPGTRVIDAGGRTVVPGLVDGHAHLDREGLRDTLPSLAGARSVADILQRVAALVAGARPGEWIVTMPIGEPPYYRGLPGALAEGRWPTRHDLDAVSPDNPVYIRAIWGYWRHELPLVSIANSAALAAAGVTRDSVPPWSGIEIERDDRGEPTGVFVEQTPVPTVELTLMAAAPRFTAHDRAEALPRSMSAYAATGTTMAFEAHGVAHEVLLAYRSVKAAGRMTVRARLAASPSWGRRSPVHELTGAFGSRIAGTGGADEWLTQAGFFLEPHLTEEDALRATAMPYTGWAGFSADAGMDPAVVESVLRVAASRDIRVVMMGTGLLDTLERVDASIPLAGRRWTIGHISTLDEREIATIARLGLHVTTHTNRYLYKQSEQLADELGPDREHELVPLRSLLAAGVPVSFGTDNVPTSLWNPVWHAVAREGMASHRVVGPDQRLGREEALRIATAGGAALTGDGARAGVLAPGRFADLAVLTGDPLTVPLDELRGLRSDLTIVGGREAHSSGAIGA